MKRTFILLSVVLILFGSPYHAHAEIKTTHDWRGFEYTYDDSGDWPYATITGKGTYICKDEEPRLEIPSSVQENKGDSKTYTVNAIGDGAFKDFKCTSGIETFKLDIPDTLRSIGNSAFQNSYIEGGLALKEVITIGDSAFEGCPKTFLNNGLTIPDTVKSIGDSAFKNIGSSNGELNLGKVESIGKDAFMNTGFTGSGGHHSIIIPNSVTSIGDSAFAGMIYIDDGFVIPKSVTSIGSSLFDSSQYLYTYDSVYEIFKQNNTLKEDQVIIFMEDFIVGDEDGNTEVYVKKGEKIKLSYSVIPSTAYHEEDPDYSSCNVSSYISVDNNGVVTGIKEGDAYCSVFFDRRNEEKFDQTDYFSYDFWIHVVTTMPVRNVELSPSVLTLKPGETKTLTATVKPANADNQNVTWSSSDSSVVSVDSAGNIKALKAGSATITVTTEDGKKTASCTVTVGLFVSVPVKASVQTDGNKGAPANLDSKKLKLVLTVKQNGAPYKSQELEVDTQTLSEGSLDFYFPSGTPTFVWGAEVSLKGFSGTVKDKNNNNYQLSGIADINGKGEISVVLNFSKKAGGGKKTHGYPAWNLPEDEIGAYHIDPVTGQKEYLMFQTYNICMKYMKNDEYCASYEHCFHKEEVNYEINWKK